MVIWIMTFAQLIVWGWFSAKGGKLSDKQFLVFTAGMLMGQLGVGINSYEQAAWPSFVVQVYFFFFFTALGGIQRFRQMRIKARP